METNSKIVKDLIELYNNLSSDPIPKFRGETVVDSRLVINKEWNDISDRRIDLIIVLDNPGKNEENENIYLSPSGPAGKNGRTFISQYFSIHKKKGQVLVLNKTPFWSNKSESLLETCDSTVEKSVKITFEAIKKLWILNNKMSILVLGLNKKAIMNEVFFKCLINCENDKFKKNIFFGKHPSFGHLGNQFASALVSEIITRRKIKMNRILKRFNDLNEKVILKDYGLKV